MEAKCVLYFLTFEYSLISRRILMTLMNNGIAFYCNQSYTSYEAGECILYLTECFYFFHCCSLFSEIASTCLKYLYSYSFDRNISEHSKLFYSLAYQVPRVFINGQCIGGGSDTKELHQQGKLRPLIEQCTPCCSSEGSGSGAGSG